ncbi:MAG: DUF1501 domain-containing protein, partial [Armatimonadota bacterium]
MSISHHESHKSRREFLWLMGAGFPALALVDLLSGDGFLGQHAVHAATPADTKSIRKKAKSCIFLFMFGGPSQVDLFDYKPELQRRDGQSIDNEFRRATKTKAVLQASRRSFAQHG